MRYSYGIHRGITIYVFKTQKKGEHVFTFTYGGVEYYAPIWWDILRCIDILLNNEGKGVA